jgi:hypothetical protein
VGEMKNDDKITWLDYMLISVVFAIVVASLYFLFMLDTSAPEKIIERDTLLIKAVDSHEQRLDRIDTLHLKYINEK